MLSPFQYNRISTLYAQLLASSNQSTSSANCSINIGTISGTLSKNCIINVENICTATDDSLNLLQVAIDKILSLENKDETQPASTSLKDVFYSLKQNCVAQASLIQKISIQNIDLGVCSSTVPVKYLFINSGSAAANCYLSSILNLTNKEETKVLAKDYSKTVPWIFSGLFIGSIILIVCQVLIELKTKKEVLLVTKY